MGTGDEVRDMLAHVQSYDEVSMTPVERLLMATDGTVTHMLEAVTRSPVDVEIIDRTVEDGVLDRWVKLKSHPRGRVLVWARSQVHLDALDDAVAGRLVSGDIGIGDLLHDEFTETRRRILNMSVAREGSPSMPDFIEPGPPVYLARTYKVFSDGQEVMEITEWFPHGVL